MTADVTQDRRVTVPTLGFVATVVVEGSRLCWALPSLVHEGLGYRAIEPDRIQGDAVLPHACTRPRPGITSRPLIARATSRPIKPRTGLAAVKAATRRLRRWPAASLDRGCARRSAEPEVGTKKRSRSNKETSSNRCAPRITGNTAMTKRPNSAHLLTTNPIQGWAKAMARSFHAASLTCAVPTNDLDVSRTVPGGHGARAASQDGDEAPAPLPTLQATRYFAASGTSLK